MTTDKTEPRPPRPGPAKRLLFAAILLLLVVVAAEALSALLSALLFGPVAWPARTAAERRTVLGIEEETAAISAVPPPLPAGLTEQVIHPFVGFVHDPAAVGEGLALHGFPLPRGTVAQPPAEPETVVVGVFGGSVAQHFSAFSPRLATAVGQLPEYRDRPVAVRCLAIGGFKQPQQLQALSYLLSLGERFDLVINLDGFNEVALPWNENRGDTYFAFPRGWPLRVAATVDPETVTGAGVVAVRRDERRRLAERFSRAPLSWSITAGLIWRLLDRNKAAAVSEAEAVLQRVSESGRSFAATGPLLPAEDDGAYLDRLVALWQRSSHQMKTLVEAQGGRYVHFLQPNQYLPGSKPIGAVERRQAISRRHPYRQAVAEGYPRLRRAGAELAAEGVAFYDLTQLFAEQPEPRYIDTCCHLNSQGNLELLAAVMEALRGRRQPGRAPGPGG